MIWGIEGCWIVGSLFAHYYRYGINITLVLSY